MPKRSIIEMRSEQMFPVLEPAEIERVRRFGSVRSYQTGEMLAKIGSVAQGLTIVLKGKVKVSRNHHSGRTAPIVTHGVGSFMGELAQLSGRPSLVDAYAEEAVDALVIPPNQLRALLIAEADLASELCAPSFCAASGSFKKGPADQ